MTYEKFVIVEVHNGGIGVERFESAHPITNEALFIYYTDNRGLNWEKDTISIIESPSIVTI